MTVTKAVFGMAVAGAVALGTGAAPHAGGQTAPARVSAVERVMQGAGGSVGWIGVTVRDPSQTDAERSRVQGAGGVVVDEVSRESPAETAGLKSGDVIVEYDGERVRGTRQFSRLVQETPAGRKVAAVVMRAGQRTPLTVEPRARDGFQYFDRLEDLQELAHGWAVPAPPAPPAPPARPTPPAHSAPPVPPSPPRLFSFEGLAGGGAARLGLSVSELQPQLAEYFGARGGVLVASVAADSAGARAGLKAGDVITAMNGVAVRSTTDLRQRTLRLGDGEEFSVEILRDRKATTLKGKADAAPSRRRGTVL